MKVLHVCETMMGGVGTYLNEIVPLHLQALGSANVVALVPFEDKGQIPNLKPENIRFFHRPSRRDGLPRLVIAFVKTVFTFRPDIVHVHSTFGGLIVRAVGLFLGLKIVYSPHGWAMDRYRAKTLSRAVAGIERLLAAMTKRLIAVSEQERQEGLAIGIPPGKIVTVHNGISPEPPAFSPALWNDSRLKTLFVGRLDRQKGIDLLLEAIEGLHDRITLRVIGDRIVDCGSVSFENHPHAQRLGWLSLGEVAAQMAVCDVVVMPSRWEGLPFVAIEAMRLGKPVFAAQVGGMAELVLNEKTGALFPPEDSQALRNLLTSTTKEELAAMGQAGRALFLSAFTSERAATAALTVYRDICQK